MQKSPSSNEAQSSLEKTTSGFTEQQYETTLLREKSNKKENSGISKKFSQSTEEPQYIILLEWLLVQHTQIFLTNPHTCKVM